MDIKPQPKLKFLGVDIVNIDYFANSPLEPENDVELSVDPKLFFPESDSTRFSIIMAVQAKFQESFSLSVQCIGNFILKIEENEGDLKKAFANSNAVAIMFPYVRAFITTLTSNLGSVASPIILPPQFFKGDLDEYKPSSVE